MRPISLAACAALLAAPALAAQPGFGPDSAPRRMQIAPDAFRPLSGLTVSLNTGTGRADISETTDAEGGADLVAPRRMTYWLVVAHRPDEYGTVTLTVGGQMLSAPLPRCDMACDSAVLRFVADKGETVRVHADTSPAGGFGGLMPLS